MIVEDYISQGSMEHEVAWDCTLSLGTQFSISTVCLCCGINQNMETNICMLFKENYKCKFMLEADWQLEAI